MKRKKRTRRLPISFAITFGALAMALILGIAFLPVGNGVITRHIAGELPFYSGVLGAYTPLDALQVSYNNLTAIREINATALQTGNYLVFEDPKLNLTAPSIEQRVSVVLSAPNATVDVAILSPSAFLSASEAFDGSSLQRSHVGSAVVFSATEVSSGKPLQTLVALLAPARAFISSAGGPSAQTAMNKVIAVHDGSQQSLLSDSGVRRMLYVANGTSGHLGMAIQNYAGVVTTGQMTMITVDKLNGSLAVNYFVKFSNSTRAGSQVKYFQQVYLGSNEYFSYDDILLAVQTQPLSSIVKTVAIVG